ncbi:MAG TPA: AbrB/MazE/SpoVT family DNA-binding domain-containing protein [Candidatus Binataceae bacterium]|nr:AbrB/MazE/SpoVT family DNA-binding domain-containing protein [Candidatus Binataceae bacterium]
MARIAATRIGPKFQVVIPKKLRDAARLHVGDFLRAELRRDGILLKPAILVERDPDLEADIAASEADFQAGRFYGPFEAKDAVKGLLQAIKQERKRSRGSAKGGRIARARRSS